jgi:hypothetical protein
MQEPLVGETSAQDRAVEALLARPPRKKPNKGLRRIACIGAITAALFTLALGSCSLCACVKI